MVLFSLTMRAANLMHAKQLCVNGAMNPTPDCIGIQLAAGAMLSGPNTKNCSVSGMSFLDEHKCMG